MEKDEIPLGTHESTDKLIAEDLSKLSLTEREIVYEDIHGVLSPVVETPDLIRDKLIEMEVEINVISEKDAYEQAKVRSKECVSNENFRVKFLRAVCFVPKKAAERFVNYFKYKLIAFGPEKLVEPITYDDLTEEDIEILERGGHQILPSRDNQGRAVVVSVARHWNTAENPNRKDIFQHKIRAFWYLFSTLYDDEDTQRHGFVHVFYTIGAPETLTDKTRQKLVACAAEITEAIPTRMACCHYCHNSNKLIDFLPAIGYALDADSRVRIRQHQGTDSECQYKLMTFGIPVKELPVSTGEGGLKLGNHLKWIERRRQKEVYLRTNHSLPVGSVDIPSRSDVLLGRGRPFNVHPGNKRLHELVASHYEEYDLASRTEKTNMAKSIVAMVQGYSGRFLKQDDECGVWVEVSDVEARQKVNHGFRRKREFDKNSSTPSFSASLDSNDDDGQGKRLRVFPDGVLSLV